MLSGDFRPCALMSVMESAGGRHVGGTRGKTPGTSKPLIGILFSNITANSTCGCEEVLHRIAQYLVAIYSGTKVNRPEVFLRLSLDFQLVAHNRQTISIRGAE